VSDDNTPPRWIGWLLILGALVWILAIAALVALARWRM